MPGATPTAYMPSLADVLCAAPPLLELLSSASLTSLLCTSSGLRQIVHRHVRGLSLPPKYPCDLDTLMLANGGWLQLERLDISFNDLDATTFKQLQKAYWPLLKHLDVSGNILTSRAVKSLAKMQCPKLDFLAVGHTCLVSQPAVEHLASNHWSMLKTLHLPRVNMKADAMAKLAKAQWPQLQDLDLSYNGMDVYTIHHIADGNWRQLTSLNLSGNCIAPAVANRLITANWLSLESLTLEYCELVAESLPSFVNGQWPKLHILNIAHNHLWQQSELSERGMCIVLPGLSKLDLACTGLYCVSKTVLRSWCTIQHLNLTENDLDDEFVDRLLTADLSCIKSLGFQFSDYIGSSSVQLSLLISAWWPVLESLDLSRHWRCDYLVRALSISYLPHLTSLHLSQVGFCDSDAAFLVTGNWPKLMLLNLDYNDLDTKEMHACITTLVSGQWPLQQLSVRGNRMSTECMAELLRDGWPSLERLDLPSGFEYGDICTGTVRHDPLEPGLVHLHAPRCLCVHVMQHLRLITFSDSAAGGKCW